MSYICTQIAIAQCYMSLGGIPFYLSLLDVNMSVAQNIDSLCFNKSGALSSEFFELYNALFANADDYISVVRILATKTNGMTYSEIADASGVSGSKLTKILCNLERCDRNRKSLVNTFVTSFGIANGSHTGVVNSEVTLDSLFAK